MEILIKVKILIVSGFVFLQITLKKMNIFQKCMFSHMPSMELSWQLQFLVSEKFSDMLERLTGELNFEQHKTFSLIYIYIYIPNFCIDLPAGQALFGAAADDKSAAAAAQLKKKKINRSGPTSQALKFYLTFI